MQIDAVFCDLDGTLLNDNHEVSQKNQEIIKMCEDKNIPFHIVTGRSYESVAKIKPLHEFNSLMGTLNGAAVWNPKESKPEYLLNLNDEAKHYLKERAVELQLKYDFSWLAYSRDKIFVDSRDAQYIRKYEKMTSLVTIEKNIEDAMLQDVNKVVFASNDNQELIEVIKNLKENLGELGIWSVISQSHLFEYLPIEATKAKSVQVISQIHGYDIANCIAFGDNFNDEPMLDIVGHPVIMDNGQKDLQQKYANRATNNNNNAIYEYLIKYIG